MVRIRFRRVGSRHQPYYRIVVADKESPRDGRFLTILGHYNPRTEPATIEVDEVGLFHWLKRGAQPSESLVKVLKTIGIWERWERYKAGDDLEVLLEEARISNPEVDPRTRRDDLFGARAPKKGEAETPAAKRDEEKPEKKAKEEPAAVEEQRSQEPETADQEEEKAEKNEAEALEQSSAELEADEAQAEQNEPGAETA